MNLDFYRKFIDLSRKNYKYFTYKNKNKKLFNLRTFVADKLKEVNVKGEDTVISFVDYQKMDKSQTLDDYFFDRDLINENGQLFISNYKNYSSTFNNILDSITFLENSSEKENKILFNFESVKKDLKNRFKYQDFVINSQGIKQPYLEYIVLP